MFKLSNMNFIKQNWFKLSILVILIVVFYWMEVRPGKIMKLCNDVKVWSEMNGISFVDSQRYYKDCLLEHGLAK